MRVERFRMERAQSLYENEVEWNLSESGVEPLRVEELLENDAIGSQQLATSLSPESNGSRLLRERVAAFYPGASAVNVLVTTGTSEANYTPFGLGRRKPNPAGAGPSTWMASTGRHPTHADRHGHQRKILRRQLPEVDAWISSASGTDTAGTSFGRRSAGSTRFSTSCAREPEPRRSGFGSLGSCCHAEVSARTGTRTCPCDQAHSVRVSC